MLKTFASSCGLCLRQSGIKAFSSSAVVPGREELIDAHRIVVQLGSSIVMRSSGSGIAFGRLFNVVEQLAQLKSTGREVILVTSGAIAAGRHRLRHLVPGTQELPIPSRPLPLPGTGHKGSLNNHQAPRTGSKRDITPMMCAASGQSGLVAIYEWMFSQYSIDCAQVSVAQQDVATEEGRQDVGNLLDDLLRGGLIPIVNEHHYLQRSSPDFEPGSKLEGDLAIDTNDGIAAVISTSSGSDLLFLMSSLDGVFSSDPTADTEAARIPCVAPGSDLSQKVYESQDQIQAATFAQQNGIDCVVTSGMVNPGTGLHRSILDSIEGLDVGTLFTTRACQPSSATND